ncbi:MAG: hypothetical protein AAFO06_24565 [Cyanobacteria bacterium J06597_16]
MRFSKSSQASSSNQSSGTNNADCFGSDDCSSRDVMCLVYPDGTTTTVPPQAGE